MLTCARCGETFDRPFRYCSTCGARMDAAATRRHEDAPRGRSAAGVVVSLLALLLLLGGAAWIGRNVTAARTCAQAVQDMDRVHPVVFRLMSAAGSPVGVSCAGFGALNPLTGERQVTATWSYQGAPYTAIYEDSPLGVLSPANATAVALDKAASSGASAVQGLLGGL